MPNNISILPPPILQHFSRILLSAPSPKFCDDNETLMKIYRYIERNLLKNASYCENRMKKVKQLQIEFLEIYGRIKEKEKDIKADSEKKAKAKTQRPFYYINCSDRCLDRIFSRLKYRSY
jgi:hypothetical protein